MKLRKKLLLAFLIFLLLISAGVVYLNNFYLPTKIKSLIVEQLEQATGKKVTLDTVKLNLLKGLVVRGLNVYDQDKPLIELKEGSCTFLPLLIFKKMIIFPTVTFRSPVIFLERRKDNTFNLKELFSKPASTAAEEAASPSQPEKPKPKFNVFIYMISLRDATVHFIDRSFDEAFSKDIENLDANIYLSFPPKARFSLTFEIPATQKIKIGASGEYLFAGKELSVKVSLKDFSVKEFLPYYRGLGLTFPGGFTDCFIAGKFSANTIHANIKMQNRNLEIAKKDLSLKINSQTTADISYELLNKKFLCSGASQLSDTRFLGLKEFGPITNIAGKVLFSESGISSDNLLASIWGLPVAVRGSLSDFGNPLFDFRVTSNLDLTAAKKIAAERFKFIFPGQIQGAALLSLVFQNKTPVPQVFDFKGRLDITDGSVQLEKFAWPIKNISGSIDFKQDEVRWKGLTFNLQDKPYNTGGLVTNLKSPRVQFDLTGEGLSAKSDLSIANKIITIDRLSGKYLNSDFSVGGTVDTGSGLRSALRGGVEVVISDLKKVFVKSKDLLEKMKVEGSIHAQFDLEGELKDIKSCGVNARLSSTTLSLFGLKADEFFLNANHENGLLSLPLIHAALYGGKMDGSGRIELAKEKQPFILDVNIQGVELEKLKADTKAKDKDISGTINCRINANGNAGDLNSLSGSGNFSITDGKLWELNLFKGMGSFLLVKDFANIVFYEGSSNFTIKDKSVSTQLLTLKSNIVDLTGPVRIGFDDSIDATLDVNMISEFVPLSGTFKDVTTAIMGQAGKFGEIKISGTMKEPKYKFRPAVGNILKGLKNTIFGIPSE